LGNAVGEIIQCPTLGVTVMGHTALSESAIGWREPWIDELSVREPEHAKQIHVEQKPQFRKPGH
jgi:hypothetical protein